MIEIKFWLFVVLLIEVPAIAMVAMHRQLRPMLYAMGFDWRMMVGIYMLTAGLFVQVGRTYNYFKFGAYPVDEWFPMWVLKDIGGSIMLYCIVKLALLLWKKGQNHV